MNPKNPFSTTQKRDRTRRMATLPIGEFLQQVAALDNKSATKVLQLQKKHPSRTFGQIALDKGLVKDDLTRKYLSLKGFF
ncbi:MAG: hypothetical protein SNJ78_08580 [Spirochaetales bacterium]